MINITSLSSKPLNSAKIYLWSHETAISFWFASESMIGTNLEEDSSQAQTLRLFRRLENKFLSKNLGLSQFGIIYGKGGIVMLGC